MIVTGASLLGQILTNRTSSGLVSSQGAPSQAAPAPAGPPPSTRTEPTPASVAMSLSTLDALFALQVSSRGTGVAGASVQAVAPSSGVDAGSQRSVKPLMIGQTVVDPDLVRAFSAALESHKSKGDGAGLAVMSHH